MGLDNKSCLDRHKCSSRGNSDTYSGLELALVTRGIFRSEALHVFRTYSRLPHSRIFYA